MYHTTEKGLFRIDCGDIYLQEFSIEDVDSIFRISNEPEVFEFLPDWKSSKEQRLEWVTNYEIPANKAFLHAAADSSNIDNHTLKLGVFIKESDEFIGWCCTGIKDELPAPNRELMYAISSRHQKKGYATKASKGLIDYLFTYTNLDTINAIALTNNISSNKVIKKCGFQLEGQVTIDQKHFNHYLLRKIEWLKSNPV
ncbi:GNAT family N-acetyltransferase [Cytobacillus sp. FJAT-54145]|uniref:GNAT family N-acetyltransferase n=1 Tax=Cytobacillus spartinae TaxID=3299023 RepID=A0ABW6K588_9BACI